MMTLMMCLMTSVVFGQWTYETIPFGPSVPNEAREAFNMNSESGSEIRLARTKTAYGGSLSMSVLEYTHNDTIKLIRHNLTLWSYHPFSDSSACIDFILVVNGVNKKYKLTGKLAGKSFDNEAYIFDESIWTDEFIKDFKSASKCYIRVSQNDCTDDYYQFNFSGSAAAYDFITK